MVRKVIVDNRNDIIKQFTIECQAYFDFSNGGAGYILTHGYSKTVREVLKRGLEPLTENVPNVFVLESKVDDDFDARLMLHELKEDDEYKFLNNAAHSDEGFIKLLGSRAKVMVILGAEAFDSERRVLHPVGISDRLKTLKFELGSQCCVVVVAEEYKHHKNLMLVREFYRNHLDRVDIHTPNLIDVIITDKNIYR